MKTINDFTGEFRWLSNFWISTIQDLDGLIYPSVEHFYQASKTTNDKDREFIRLQKTPEQAKRAGRTIVQVRRDWEFVKVAVMKHGLRMKFTQHQDLMERLVGTFPLLLIEGNTWEDMFWGVCHGQGYNVLGQLLMAIRLENLSSYLPPQT